ncbi:MAG: SH3 domain-containing protein [Caulobacteraceae bacterium]
MLRSRGTGWTVATFAVLALGGCGGHVGEGKDCPAAVWSRTVSGFCVPRWVSLKRGEVYGRKGPGADYPAIWVYRVQGLPVQVVAETTDWRRICDPDGGAAWVHRSMVDGRRMVMALGSAPLPLFKTPGGGGSEAGLLNARALAALRQCQGAWCKVRAGGVAGWLEAAKVWGLAPAAQCR